MRKSRYIRERREERGGKRKILEIRLKTGDNQQKSRGERRELEED